MRIGAAVQPDHRKVEPLVGAHDLAVALGGAGEREARCADCKGVEKLTACDHLVLLGRADVRFFAEPC